MFKSDKPKIWRGEMSDNYYISVRGIVVAEISDELMEYAILMVLGRGKEAIQLVAEDKR